MQGTLRRWFNRRYAVVAAIAVAVSACGGADDDAPDAPPEPSVTAGDLGEQVVLTSAEWLETTPYDNADVEAGERQARVCLACHSLAEGGANMIGPNLYGFFGREAGAVERFDYSGAFEEVDFTWTPRALDAWLRQPAKFLPGNRMTYPGVPRKADRDNLIAYLLVATSDAAPGAEGGEE